MTIEKHKITATEIAENNIKSNSGNRLTGTAEQNKHAFDKLGELIAQKHNELISELVALGVDTSVISENFKNIRLNEYGQLEVSTDGEDYVVAGGAHKIQDGNGNIMEGMPILRFSGFNVTNEDDATVIFGNTEYRTTEMEYDATEKALMITGNYFDLPTTFFAKMTTSCSGTVSKALFDGVEIGIESSFVDYAKMKSGNYYLIARVGIKKMQIFDPSLAMHVIALFNDHELNKTLRTSLGVVGNSGTQDITDGYLRITDTTKSGGYGFQVRQPYGDNKIRFADLHVNKSGSVTLSLSEYDKETGKTTIINHLGVHEDYTDFGLPLTVGSGGTGGKTATEARENLGISLGYSPNFVAQPILNGSTQYGTSVIDSDNSFHQIIGGKKVCFVHLRVHFKLSTAIPAETWVKVSASSTAIKPKYTTPLCADNGASGRFASANIDTDGNLHLKFSKQVESSTSLIYAVSGTYIVE